MFVSYPDASWYPDLETRPKPQTYRNPPALTLRVWVFCFARGPSVPYVGEVAHTPNSGFAGSSHFGVWGVVLAWGRGLPDD